MADKGLSLCCMVADSRGASITATLPTLSLGTGGHSAAGGLHFQAHKPDFCKGSMCWLQEPPERCLWSPGLMEKAEPRTQPPWEAPASQGQEGSTMQEGLFLVFLSDSSSARLKRQSPLCRGSV